MMRDVVEKLNITCITFNVNSKFGSKPDVAIFLDEYKEKVVSSHLIAFGFQEISKAEFVGAIPAETTWPALICNYLEKEGFVVVHSTYLVINRLIVFAKFGLLPLIHCIESKCTRFGMMGLSGHKGSLAVMMRFQNQQEIVFITSHFTHAVKDYQTRINQYKESKECLFEDSTNSNAAVFWMGDLNWRLFETDSKVLSVIQKLEPHQIDAFLDVNDQLRVAKKGGHAFDDFREPKITFKPTYKLKLYQNPPAYDSKRDPAWCDRILYKGLGIRSTLYQSNPNLQISDHYPVYGSFVVSLGEILRVPACIKDQFPVSFGSLEKWYANVPLWVCCTFKNNFWNEFGSNADWIGVVGSLLEVNSPISWIYLFTTTGDENDKNTFKGELPALDVGKYQLVYFSSKLKVVKGLREFSVISSTI
uniref:IPPc domain-containing protein n=1 Tax=Rhabditophanes sp. KR3021 TaxID=114890 RepID=A0AC35TGJ1_9BILA